MSADEKVFTIEELTAMGAKNISIDRYWKYEFTISAETDDGKKINVCCGGDPDTIYKFDPHGGWSEWDCAGISYLSIDGKTVEISS
jgi:hypothetical protein